MAKKQTGSQGSNNGKAEFKGFFNPYLGSEVKKAVNALDLSSTAALNRMGLLLQDGLKLSIVSDVEGGHYTFSLFDKRSDSNSQGYVLSVKHSSLEKGIGILFFLHDEVYERGGWLEFIEGRNDLDW